MITTVVVVVFIFILAVVLIKLLEALLFDYDYDSVSYADTALTLQAAHLRIRIKREFRKLNLSKSTALRFQDRVDTSSSTTTCSIARDLGFGKEYTKALARADWRLAPNYSGERGSSFEWVLRGNLPTEYRFIVNVVARKLRRALANDLVELTHNKLEK